MHHKLPTALYSSPKSAVTMKTHVEAPVFSAPLGNGGNHQNPHMSHHVKTFSLPVAFDPSSYIMNKNAHHSNTVLPPPMRSFNQNIDVPLPPGWQSEKTATGQVYFIK